MYVEWTKHLSDPEDKANFERQVHSSKQVLDRLKDIVKEKEEALDRSETNIRTYDLPNWDHRQSHKNGNRESLAFLHKLVDLDLQRTPNDRELT